MTAGPFTQPGTIASSHVVTFSELNKLFNDLFDQEDYELAKDKILAYFRERNITFVFDLYTDRDDETTEVSPSNTSNPENPSGLRSSGLPSETMGLPSE